MSVRGTKRATASRGEEPQPSTSKPSSSKRRRTEQDDVPWHIRPVNDLKISTIYNRSASEAPAELFRKDLISAMKLPDSEPLSSNDYWIITDPWKQEWERGVQVPVNPDSLPAPTVVEIQKPTTAKSNDFKLPKHKYIRLARDSHFASDSHHLTTATQRAESACAYDLDTTDSAWLKTINGERARAGAIAITEDQLERVIEELEIRCWDKIQSILKSEEGLGIEYDENVICDVCRSPDSEEGNEMVFCDSCNICVHQACYGITTIPSGQWLCRPCGEHVKPGCVLCPNMGGAMKCTPSGHKWAHVSCVLWIPEVSIGCAERMEPITKISAIPPSRWNLICILCRERTGACIQCSVKTCKTAYHVTCAFKHGLEMRAIIEDENADDGVKLRSYCQKHSVNSRRERCAGSDSEDDFKRKRRKEMTSEEKSQARLARTQEIEAEFDKHVSIKDISTHLLGVDQDGIHYIYNYWKLKRRAGFNRPLLPPKSDDTDLMSHRQEQADLDKMKSFVQLRQDLERVRNLCYMVSRREKLSRSFFRMREQTFHKQVAVLSSGMNLSGVALTAVIEANHGPSIYDRLYSHPDAVDHSDDFNSLLARIAGLDSGDEKKKELNGLVKSKKTTTNPYKKVYINGSSRRSICSSMSSEESANERPLPRKPIYSTTDEEEKEPTAAAPSRRPSKYKAKSGAAAKLVGKKKRMSSVRVRMESSSEDEAADCSQHNERYSPRSRTLRQMEKEMTARQATKGEDGAATDSDEFIPIRPSRRQKMIDIYSDSSENADMKKAEDGSQDKSPSGNSEQQMLRTKASMKEFIPEPKGTKNNNRGRKSSTKEKSQEAKVQESDDEVRDKENVKVVKNKDYPTDLIVPQRKAAKKASENMRSNAPKAKDVMEASPESNKALANTEEVKVKPKPKFKGKEPKDILKDMPKEKKDKKSTSEEKDNQELLAYVPQRQAAKKAAAHIKSGLGNKIITADNSTDETLKKKEPEGQIKSDTTKISPKKDDDKQPKIRSKSCSSSSSGSSTTSYSGSSSTEAEDDNMETSAPKVAPTVRPSVDLPFLDKVSRPLSPSSPSSDSEAPKESSKTASRSPSPRRGRNRRLDSSSQSKSCDTSPRKAPDKKLKTSDRGSESRVQSPSVEREESRRAFNNNARSSTRSWARGTAPSRNLSNKQDSRQRKSSRDESNNINAQNTPTKEASEPSKLPTTQRKTNEAIEVKTPSKVPAASKTTVSNAKVEPKPSTEPPKITADSKPSFKGRSAKVKPTTERISARRASTKKSLSPMREQETLAKISKKTESPSMRKSSKSLSPIKRVEVTTEDEKDSPAKQLKSPIKTPEKTWSTPTKCSSPLQRSPLSEHEVNKLGKASDIEKSDSLEDVRTKSLDLEVPDKQNIKSVAKIQRDDTHIIKSPKIPLDMELNRAIPSEGVTAKPEIKEEKRQISTHSEKLTTLDPPNTPFNAPQETVRVITNKANTKGLLLHASPNRSIFSPQPTIKDNAAAELFDFSHDILAVDETVHDDGFASEEIIKPLPFTFGADFLFKEDSKADREETLNLVEKLRMTLNTKKSNTLNTSEAMTDTTQSIKLLNSEKGAGDRNADVAMSDNSQTIKPISTENNNLHIMADTYSLTSNENAGDSQGIDIDNIIVEDRTSSGASEMGSNDKWLNSGSQFSERSNEKDNDDKDSLKDQPYNIDQSRPGQHILKHTGFKVENRDLPSPKEVYNMPRTESPQNFTKSMASLKRSDSPRDMSEHHSANDEHLALLKGHTIQTPNFDRLNSMRHEPSNTPAPYESIRENAKWSESKIPQRRSSASSTTSEASVASAKIEILEKEKHEGIHGVSNMPQEITYPGPPPPYHPSMDTMPYNVFSSEASQFLTGPVSLFPSGSCSSAQLPLTSPAGAALYPPNVGIPYPSTPYPATPMPKSLINQPLNTLCAAAFTSSLHNIALTTEMIAPPTPKRLSVHSPQPMEQDLDRSPKPTFTEEPSIVESDSFREQEQELTPVQKPIESNQISPVANVDAKSPTKVTRSSTRFVASKTIKTSPTRSPVKSPKQPDTSHKSTTNRRNTSKNNRGQRGRGRAKSSRAVHNYPHAHSDYNSGSQNNLTGSVYEFDEDISNDEVDLKSMRDRRRSIDVHDRKSEHSYKDSSQSPQLTSPTQHHHVKKSSYQNDTRDLKPPSPLGELQNSVDNSASPILSTSEPTTQSSFNDIVQPVLPGPVDMRTYHSFESTPTTSDVFSNHLLGAFASGTADQQLAEIDEEVEKELHSALMASSKEAETSPTSAPIPEINEAPADFLPRQTPEISLPKVSLSDSRNQLKVKIKGPFLDANYSTSQVQPIVPQPTLPPVETSSSTPMLVPPSAACSNNSAMISGTSNLRRMRKKELLRQYWNQDMNMDEPTCNTNTALIPQPTPAPPLSRTIITIPKAVASMTSIPTREDYKAVVDANMEKKKRKISGGFHREMRHMDMSMHDDFDYSDESNASNVGLSSVSLMSHKRKGRFSGKTQSVTASASNTQQIAPKLKIKIGNNVISTARAVNVEESSNCQFRPPKKRLASIAKPSVEDLKRESMKFRRKVMADYEKEVRKKRKPKSEKRKKKKDKRASEMHVVNKESDSATKLIIRIARKKEELGGGPSGADKEMDTDEERPLMRVERPAVPAVGLVPPRRVRCAPQASYSGPAADPFHYDPTAQDPLALDPPLSSDNPSGSCRNIRTSKLTPIRLKLARSAEGSGYIMKDTRPDGAPNADPMPRPTHSVNKHCEVR